MDTRKKIFILIESIIYITFIVMDAFNTDSSYIKYFGIILCLLNSILDKNTLISLALLFTLISDYFLLLTNNLLIVGVITFIIVQFIYLYYLYKNKCNNHIIVRIIFYLLSLLIAFSGRVSMLYVVAIIYFSTLLMNTISSYSNQALLLFSIGLSLFICCDICVGLHNICNYGLIYKVATTLMWIFYLPSQVLISIGGNIHVEN